MTANIFTARLDPADGPARLKLALASDPDPMPVERVHPNEAAEVAAIRSYRTVIRGTENQIVRGDLHRHTEFSWGFERGDGGRIGI